MDKKIVNKFVLQVLFRENKKESLFQLAVFTTFLLFLFCWEPIGMYFLFAAIQTKEVKEILVSGAWVGLSLICFVAVQYVNNTYADCNSWNIITKIRERLLGNYYGLNHYNLCNRFAMGEIFDRIFQSGMGILDYGVNYLGIGVLTVLGIGYSVYYGLKIPLVLVPIFALTVLELAVTKTMSRKLEEIEADKRKTESLRAEEGERLFQDLEFSLMYGVEDVMLDQYLDILNKSWNQVTKKEMLMESIQAVHLFISSLLQILLGATMAVARHRGRMNDADAPVMLLVLGKLSQCIKEVTQRVFQTSQKRVSIKRILELLEERERQDGWQRPEASPQSGEILRATNLSVQLDGHEIIKDINLSIFPGEKVAVIGENGSGKSTFLKAVLGLVPAKTGDCLVGGADTRFWTGIQRRQVSYIPATPFLFLESVKSNLEMGMEEEAPDLMETALELCQEFVDRPVDALSGGQQQMVNICRGVLPSPRILFADEPTSHLERGQARRVMEWILDNGDTCLVVTHDLSLLPLFTRVLQVKDREIVQLSKYQQIHFL